MNPLTTYFDETGENVAKLAERMGRAPSTITRPLKGERNVSMKIAMQIEDATKGRVTAEQFISICIEAKRSSLPAAVSPCA